MNVTYNQNYMFPAFYNSPGYVGVQYPFNVYSMSGIYATAHPEMSTSGPRDPASPTEQLYSPFVGTGVSEMYNHAGVAHNSSPTRADVKPFSIQDTTSRSSCVFEDSSNHSDAQRFIITKSPSSLQADGQKSAHHHQLRLPSITVTSNMAANVMSEECDLGYCSFTDLSPLPDVTEGPETASLSELLDAQSTFSDIIDDVLDSMDSSPFGDVTSPVLSDYKWKTPAEDVICDEYKQHFNLKRKSPDQSTVTCEDTRDTPAKSHKSVESTQCALCNKTFESKSSLNVHMRQHKRERPHQCSYCGKAFTQKSTLRTHIRTHTGEKPYACTYCTRAFSDYSTFRKHVRIHTGEKPYTCEICTRSFTQSGNMLRHREMHNKAGKQT